MHVYDHSEATLDHPINQGPTMASNESVSCFSQDIPYKCGINYNEYNLLIWTSTYKN